MVTYDNPRLKNFDLARRNGRILIDGGLYTPIREDGLIVAVEPTEALLSLFDSPPPAEQLFDVLLEFVTWHQWATPRVTEICDRLIALGMRKGESLALYKAVRRDIAYLDDPQGDARLFVGNATMRYLREIHRQNLRRVILAPFHRGERVIAERLDLGYLAAHVGRFAGHLAGIAEEGRLEADFVADGYFRCP